MEKGPRPHATIGLGDVPKTVEIEPGDTVVSVLSRLGYKVQIMPIRGVTINGKETSMWHQVRDGDDIWLSLD